MKESLLVAFGGGLGSLARWSLGSFVLHHTANCRLPFATLVVNVLGCVVAGVVAGLIIKQDMFSPNMRLFLLTGLLGGFTTFSAFGVECMHLVRRGEFTIAGLYVLLSVAGGIGGLMFAVALMPARLRQP